MRGTINAKIVYYSWSNLHVLLRLRLNESSVITHRIGLDSVNFVLLSVTSLYNND